MIKQQKIGIEETREVIKAVNELLLFFIKRFKDGVQYDDFIAFYSEIIADQETKALMVAAFDGYKKIPSEVQDIDVAEACQLLYDQVAQIPRIVEALKKT